MDVSITEARHRLTQLLRAFEDGESVVITRNGKPVAQLAPPPPTPPIRWGTLRGKLQLLPGWDDPIDIDRFIEGDI